VDVSYLADTVILLRYFEVAGSVRQAISVVKKRSGDHERMIRECRVQQGGLFVGEPLRGFRGVLTGVPEYTGASEPLLPEQPLSDWDGSGRGKTAAKSPPETSGKRLTRTQRGSADHRA
jgi:hypothetical protein